MGLVADPLADQPDEVGGAAGQLEADQVGAEQPLEQLAPPRQLLEQLGRRERDVQVEADPQVGPELAQHLRDQLHLVVVHPHQGALVGQLGGLVGEPLVDLDVGVPPLAVELRLGHQVVVERPQGGVGEALVVALDLLGGHRHRVQVEAVGLERLEVLLGAARPAHPDPVVGAHHRLDRGDQAAGRGSPLDGAVGLLDPVDRQPVRDDHEVMAHALHPRHAGRAAYPTPSEGAYAARLAGDAGSAGRAAGDRRRGRTSRFAMVAGRRCRPHTCGPVVDLAVTGARKSTERRSGPPVVLPTTAGGRTPPPEAAQVASSAGQYVTSVLPPKKVATPVMWHGTSTRPGP